MRIIPAFGLALLIGLTVGCEEPPPSKLNHGKPSPFLSKKPADQPGAASDKAAHDNQTSSDKSSSKSSQSAETKTVKLGPGLHLEVQGERRRILIESIVVLRELGSIGLECLVCKKDYKEHESILATHAKAKEIHAALEACRAKPGHPVKYQDRKVIPPTGSPVRITLRYEDKKRGIVEVDAREWVMNIKTKKPLEHDWVFAGSKIYKSLDEPDKPPVYAADAEGGYICIANVVTALLDLPVYSPKGEFDRGYVPWTEKIPELDTPVTVILEPLPEKN
jgi:hypothetical protein